jgi:hypothetical protein
MEKIIKWRGLDVTVTETREPAMDAWDGDEPQTPTAEGWDLSVTVRLQLDHYAFEGFDQLASNWIEPDADGFKYLDDTIVELTDGALDDLMKNITNVSCGVDVERERKRQSVASSVIERMEIE